MKNLARFLALAALVATPAWAQSDFGKDFNDFPAIAQALGVSNPTYCSTLGKQQLLNEFQACSDQGQGPGCITPAQVRDVICSIQNVANTSPALTSPTITSGLTVDQIALTGTLNGGALQPSTPLGIAYGGTSGNTATAALNGLGVGPSSSPTFTSEILSGLAGSGNRCVYADPTGKLNVINSTCGTGSGSVSGPGSSTNGFVPLWSGTSGTTLGTGLAVGTSGANTILETDGFGNLSNVSITGGSISGVSFNAGNMALSGTLTGGTLQPSTAIGIGFGGTGSTTAGTARTALGLGTIATLSAPLAGASGGTGATTIGGALTNLMASAAVATNAALIALNTNGFVSGQSAVYRQGFSAAGDGGSAFYTYSNTACSLNSGNGDNGSQVNASSGGCWLADFSTIPPNVMQWGAACNATSSGSGTDDAVPLQAALTAASSLGATITWPEGKLCRSSTTLQVGLGSATTQLGSQGSPASTGIICDLSVTPCVQAQNITSRGLTMKGVGISRASGTIPGGSIGLEITNSSYVNIDDLSVYRSAIGVQVDTGSIYVWFSRLHTCTMSDADVVISGAPGIYFYGGQIGCNGNTDVGHNAYVRLTGNWDTTKGTVHFNDVQFNDGVIPGVTCGFSFSGFTGSTNVIYDVEILSGHMEVAQNAFCSDSSVKGITLLQVHDLWIVGGWGGGNHVFADASNSFAAGLNPTTTINSWTMTGTSLTAFADLTLNPTAQINDLKFTGDSLIGPPVRITGAANSTLAMTGNSYNGVALAGSFGSAIISGESQGGSYSNSATGPVKFDIPNIPFNGLGDPTGTNSSTAAIQNTVNTLCAQSPPGGRIPLSGGTFKIKDINVPCSVVFAGQADGTTVLDYSGSVDHGIQFSPTGWPNVTRRNMPNGPGVQDITFTSSSGSTRALDFIGSSDCFAHRVKFTGSGSYNGIRLYGVWHCDLDGITTGYFISPTNAFVEIGGDYTGTCDTGLSGCGSQGSGTCTLGNCSTRTDLVTIRNTQSSGNAGAGIYIHDAAFTIIGEHIAIENRAYGLQVACAAGHPNITYCPQAIFFTDFESEGATTANILLTDFSDFRCVSCYALGGTGATNNIFTKFVNYSQSGGAGFGTTLIGGSFFGSTADCVAIGTDDVYISNSTIYNCNISAGSFSGVELVSGAHHSVTANHFCTQAGTTPSTMLGIKIDSGVDWVDTSHNLFAGCSGSVTNGSSGTHIASTNNLGP